MAEKNEKQKAKEEKKVNDEEIKEEKVVEETADDIKSEVEELTDRYKRLMAEFDNYKKRSLKEKESLYDSLKSDVVTPLLPVMDNLEQAANAETTDEGYKKGVELVLKQFQTVFTSLGIETIETVGSTFNPEYHEAVSSVADPDLGEKEIKTEYRKGYKIGNKVIRHAMVVVAN